MDNLTSLIPAKYQILVAALMFVGSHADRAWRVIQSIGGVKGAWRTLLNGDESKPSPDSQQPTK